MVLLSIAKHAALHQITALKRYGQNFLFDSSLCDKIVRASGLQEGQFVLEIGPGTAGLTRSILAQKPKSLTVVEMDQRCLPLLQDIKAHYPNLDIIQGDALKIKIADLNAPEQIHIVANLPYHIGTELVIMWLKQAKFIHSMTLMLQREVVNRICANPGTKEYGRLSVICQLMAKVKKCFDVSPEAFYPPPKIYSSVIKFTPESDVLSCELVQKVELITRLAFSARRKMIKSSLKKLSPNIMDLLDFIKINANVRAENLTPCNYLSLARLI